MHCSVRCCIRRRHTVSLESEWVISESRRSRCLSVGDVDIVFCLAMQFIFFECVLCWKHIVDLPFCYRITIGTMNSSNSPAHKRHRMYFIGAYCIYVWGRSLSLTGKYFDIVNNDFTSVCISFHFIPFRKALSMITKLHIFLGNELKSNWTLNYH